MSRNRLLIIMATFIIALPAVFACITPSGDDTNITNQTDTTYICTGTYYINDTNNNGIFNFTDNTTLDCNNSLFIGNLSGYGIYLENNTNITILNCNFTNFQEGLYLNMSTNNTLTSIRTYNNTQSGITLDHSTGNSITSIESTLNTLGGLTLNNSANNTYSSLTLSNNTYGFNILNTTFNYTFIDTTVTYNDAAISLLNTTNFTLINSTICNNTQMLENTSSTFNISQNTFCINLVSPLNYTIISSNLSANFTFNTSNHLYPATCTLYVNGSAEESNTNVTENVNQRIAHSENVVGNYSWYINCSDSFYNNGVSTEDFFEVLNNTPPTHATPLLYSSSGNNYSQDTLSCLNQGTYDADGDAVTNIYNWRKDGVIQNINLWQLHSGYTAPGENWTCLITPHDGTNNGTQRESNPLLIVANPYTGGGSPLILKGGSPLILKGSYEETPPTRTSRKWDELEPGEEATFNVGKIDFAITRVLFTPLKTLDKATIILEVKEELPITVDPIDDIYEIYRFSNYNFLFSEVKDIVIEFRVKKLWFSLNNYDEKKVYLNRYFNDKWQRLPTTYVTADADFHHYKATTDGFSYFAITSGEKPIPEIETTPPTIITSTRDEPEGQGQEEGVQSEPIIETPTEIEEQKKPSIFWPILVFLTFIGIVSIFVVHMISQKKPAEFTFKLSEEKFDHFNPEDLHPSQHLSLVNGKTIKNIKDFYMALVNMNKFDFEHHLNAEFLDDSDFFKWAEGSLGDSELAQNIKDVKDQKEMVRIVRQRILEVMGQSKYKQTDNFLKVKRLALDLRAHGISKDDAKKRLYDAGWSKEIVDPALDGIEW